MPATEQTWRDQKKLHVIFAVSSVLMLLATMWMFTRDSDRQWKDFQRKSRDIKQRMTMWRNDQFTSADYLAEHTRLQQQLVEVRRMPFDKDLLAAFKNELEVAAQQPDVSAPNFTKLDELLEEHKEAAEEAADKAKAEAKASALVDKLRKDLAALKESLEAEQAAAAAAEDTEAAQEKVDGIQERIDSTAKKLESAEETLAEAETEATKAAAAVAPIRADVLEVLEGFVDKAKFRETVALQRRKFKSANLDKLKGDLGLGVSAGLSEEELTDRQVAIDKTKEELDALTDVYQARQTHRENLAEILADLTAAETEAEKKLSDHQADAERLATSFRETRATWFVYGILPGKKFLELPILDAFQSPLKIENNWSEGLTQNYNFSDVRRFDRCVTCHQAIQQTKPGSAVEPAYPAEHDMVFTLEPGEPLGEDYQPNEALDPLEQQVNRVRAIYGLNLADQGLVDPDDVTVRYVRPQSIAASARSVPLDLEEAQLPDAFRAGVLQVDEASEAMPIGLLPGDVIAEIDGDRVADVRQAAFQFLDAADEGRSLTLTIRRGLPQPYTSHPRLDLFVGSLSPHKLADFACTICHEGQGSATEFKWASHTPQDPLQQEAWRKQYGWFDNHHWIYPMLSKQFHESTCLKCHHEVVELEPSEQFAEAPAPKLMHGYNLIRKYGCYGCHEINGYDGSDRIGPDMRAEPNYFAAAQALKVDPGYDSLTSEEKSWVETLVMHPERDAVRKRLVARLKVDAEGARRLSDHAYTSLLPTLGDLENPGELPKPGPSLRFVGTKLDSAFLYNWIWNPKDFRPSTRMPRFFGLWDHLKDDHKSLAVAEKFEPMEAYAMGYYLQTKSQEFAYLDPPEGITASTAEEKAARGRVLFEERGCLACHSHGDFPELAKFRPAGEIQQGPDLTGIGDKFDPERNPNGRKWLYSWIKKPNRYHVRTVMPDLYLDPIKKTDEEGNVTVTDPADDITEYLMQSRGNWTPGNAITSLDGKQQGDLDDLAVEHLRDAFSNAQADQVVQHGIPLEMEAGLKGAEKELLVEDATGDLSLDLKLKYVGRKTIAKYGCFGCHDIPGFEDAKPIGTGLADWGRKEPAKLAFEHIMQYLEHGHSGHGHGGHGPGGHGHDGEGEEEGASDQSGDDNAADESDHDDSDHDALPPFYESQLNAHNRIGFLYQKLREPRGYDYHKTLNKKYNERLRMPEFPFTVEEREAVMTFVLGLVAEPPSAKYIYQPDERMDAIVKGRKVLEKYNCGGCHILEAEKWELALQPGMFGEQQRNPSFPFAVHDFTKAAAAESAKPGEDGLVRTTLTGMPTIENDGYPRVFDLEQELLYEEDSYTSDDVLYSFDIWKPTLIDGHDYQVGSAMLVPGTQITKRFPTKGGLLAKYLLPRVVAREQQVNPNAKGSEAWGWVPPPLVGQGGKTQTEWLHSFLMDPHMIRPAVVLRMPNFSMTSEEAQDLVNYFSAIDQVEYPYVFNERRESEYLRAQESQYLQLLQSESVSINEDGVSPRFSDAMKIVTSSNYCVKCHIIGEYTPSGADRAKAPNLGIIYKRLRPDYLRKWIGQPTSILPYTSMPVNIPYNPDAEYLGTTVPQDLYHGTSIEQVDGLVDLLMNYDLYAKQRTKILPLVEAGKAPVEGAAPAEGGDATTEATEATSADNAAAAEAGSDATDTEATDTEATDTEATDTEATSAETADSEVAESPQAE